MTNDAIIVMTTGGTIDKLYFDALSEFKIGDSVVPAILKQARVTDKVVARNLMRKDSLELTDADRAFIVAEVGRCDAGRIIITHGTDTMTQTAEALSGIVGKTIVLVGALAPARFSETDAAFNIGMAFAAVQIAPPGVYITMNGIVFRNGEARKDRLQGAFVRVTV